MSDSKTTRFVEADWLRLVRYLEGDLPPEEVHAVDLWLAEQPDRSELFARLREEWDGAASMSGAEQWDVDAAVEGVLQRVAAVRPATHFEERRSGGLHSHSGSHRETRTWFRAYALPRWRTWRDVIGATAAVVFGVGILRLVGTHHANDAAVGRTYATAAGEQAEITLQDGTHVMLAPSSMLQVLQLDQQQRKLRVQGEAYFDVARSSGAPFIVQTGAIQTRVLGTAFLVRSPDSAHGTQGAHIAVVAGRVGVTPHSAREYPVNAGEIADATDSTVQVAPVNAATMRNTQTDTRFIFRETPVSKILQVLTQWYGREFRCADSALANVPVNVAVSARSSAVALSVLEQVLNVNIVAHGDTITLVPQRTGPANARPVRARTYDVWTPAREVGR